MATRFERTYVRTDTAANWSSANPILRDKEVGYERTPGRSFKVGDGTTAWNDLAYADQTDNTPWTAYTPAVSAFSGTLGSFTASGWFKTVGKTVHVQLDVTITNAGSGTLAVNVGLPVAVKNSASFAGRESAQAGFGLCSAALANSSTLVVQKYDATFPGASGNRLILSGVYEGV